MAIFESKPTRQCRTRGKKFLIDVGVAALTAVGDAALGLEMKEVQVAASTAKFSGQMC